MMLDDDRRLTRTDGNRDPTKLVHGAKTILVGGVVADHHRNAPGKRSAAHQLIHRTSLMVA